MRPIGENEHIINVEDYLSQQQNMIIDYEPKEISDELLMELMQHFGISACYYDNIDNLPFHNLVYKKPITYEDLIQISLIIQDEGREDKSKIKILEIKTMKILLERLNNIKN